MRWYFFVALGILLFTGVFAIVLGGDFVILNPEGFISEAQRNLLYLSVALMLVVVLPVYVLIGVFAWQYRAENQNARYRPNWANNHWLEFGWWAIPIVIISILGYVTWETSHSLDPYRPIESAVPPITINVVALDWKWLFIYPEEGIATVNYVAFPLKTPVEFVITADAPMNSFWIPALGGQIYAMTGMASRLHLMADRTGEYQGSSANFSGRGFAGMRFVAEATTEEEFQRIVREAKRSSLILDQGAYDTLRRPTENNSVVLYGAIDQKLFNRILEKYQGSHDMNVHHP